ncbi:oligosaccharide flippase family protein, partial [Escherichia coli]|nr:oligosaccharide flippase family protein [Escherichia coli]HBB3783702.1 oligosaccharide flippase family protein [Escherichia coli]
MTSIENLRSALVAVKPGAVACRIINMIWKNFGYLSLFNLITIAFPLLTYPYLTQYLGADYFSKSIYIQTIISYFTVFVGFGINISGTKIIAAHRNDKNEIDKIFWQFFVVKLFLASISTMLLVLVVISFEDCFFYFLSFPLIYAELFFPQWYYQGMERMKNITIINLVSRVMVFLMIIF